MAPSSGWIKANPQNIEVSYGEETIVEKTNITAKQLEQIKYTIDVIREKLLPILRESLPQANDKEMFETQLQAQLSSIQNSLTDIQDRIAL